MSNNYVKEWGEFQKLAELPLLEELVFVGERLVLHYEDITSSFVLFFYLTGNPLEEKHSAEKDWREQVLKRLPKLKKLDGMH